MTLFEYEISRIRSAADMIELNATTLAGAKHLIDELSRYDLKASEQNLRNAADKIAALRDRFKTEGREKCCSNQPQ